MNVFKATNSTMVIANTLAMTTAGLGLFVLPFLYFYTHSFTLAMLCVASLVLWQVFNVIGIAAGAHRYFSHRAFVCNRFWQYVMAYFCMVSLVGPPCVWAEAHRVHHAHSDTDKDPYLKWTLGGGQPFRHTTKVSLKFVRRMVNNDRLHYLTLKYFWVWVLSWVALSALVGLLIPDAGPMIGVVFFWLIPAGLSQLTLRLVLWTGHLPFLGYRNHDVDDHSNNWWLMSLLAAGEGWHNNHHYNPRGAKAGEKWWEFDITWWFIKLIKK